MVKFSGKQAAPTMSSPVRTKNKQDPDTETFEGGEGFVRDAKSELFLLAVTNMVGEDTFYESGKNRDNRFKELAFKVTKKDPEWIRDFIPYLRNTMQMRSASIVLAAHYVAAGGEKGRNVVDSAISRADEPAEILAFWAQEYGKNFPQPIKRGVADAVLRLYNQWNVLKYDGQSKAWRFGDVIELVHPKPETSEQSELFKYLIGLRHNREDLVIPASASVLVGMDALYKIPVHLRRDSLRAMQTEDGMQGMTWERLSEWLQGPMDAEAWQSIIPSMGYMALLRNLRNFDQAKISKDTEQYVRDFLGDAERVANSRQFPIRFYSAWKATDSLTYARELEEALDFSVANIPEVKGKSLVLIDVSGSMHDPMSGRSTTQRWEVAAVFGAAFAKRNDSDLVVFQTHSTEIEQANSVLKTVDKIKRHVGGGTNTWLAVSSHYNPSVHKRIIIITDEQVSASYGYSYRSGGYRTEPMSAPELKSPMYTFNVAGYAVASTEQGKNGSYAFGGLTDAGFKMISTLESLQSGRWPWQA